MVSTTTLFSNNRMNYYDLLFFNFLCSFCSCTFCCDPNQKWNYQSLVINCLMMVMASGFSPLEYVLDWLMIEKKIQQSTIQSSLPCLGIFVLDRRKNVPSRCICFRFRFSLLVFRTCQCIASIVAADKGGGGGGGGGSRLVVMMMMTPSCWKVRILRVFFKLHYGNVQCHSFTPWHDLRMQIRDLLILGKQTALGLLATTTLEGRTTTTTANCRQRTRLKQREREREREQ